MTPRGALVALAALCCATVLPCDAGIIPRPSIAFGFGGLQHAVVDAKVDIAAANAASSPPAVARTGEAFRAPQPTSPGPGAASVRAVVAAVPAVVPAVVRAVPAVARALVAAVPAIVKAATVPVVPVVPVAPDVPAVPAVPAVPGVAQAAAAPLGAVRAGPGRLPAPGAEPALDPDHALAHPAHLDSGAALDAAAALPPVPGAVQRPGALGQLGVAAQARAEPLPEAKDKPSKPAMKDDTPVMKDDTPIMKDDKPIMKDDTPVMKVDTSVTKNKPVVKIATPVMKDEKPIMKNGTPVMKDNTPVMKDKPVLKVATPVLMDDPPVMKDDKPVMRKETPVEPQDKGALLQSIASVLGAGAKPQQATPTPTPTPQALPLPLPPVPASHPTGQVRPAKPQRFSNSLLPALVQVLNHIVDLVEEREQVVEVPAPTTTASPPAVVASSAVSSAPAHPPGTIEVTVVSPSKPGAAADPNQVVISGPLTGVASLLSSVVGSISGSPANAVNTGTASVSIVENGPKAEAVTEAATEAVTEAATEAATEAVTVFTTESMVQTYTEVVSDDGAKVVLQDVTEPSIGFVSVAETAADDVTEAVTEAITENSAEARTEARTEAVTEAVTESTAEATTMLSKDDTIKHVVAEVVKQAIQEAVAEVVADTVKGVVAEAVQEIFKGDGKVPAKAEPAASSGRAVQDADEDMQEDMPVVQNDVPVVNEETVPMTMMMSMVMDDAGPLSFDMSPAEEDDEAAAAVPAVPGRSRRAAQDIFPDEFKAYVQTPTGDRQDDEAAETVTPAAEDDDVLDDAMISLPQYRGEAAAVGKKQAAGGPSQPLLALIKLRYALTAETKRQNFKNYQGFSDTVYAALVKTSTLTAREQLGVLLAGVLDQKAVRFTKTTMRVGAALAALDNPKSELSLALADLPALKYSP